jgi:hypothetical protein
MLRCITSGFKKPFPEFGTFKDDAINSSDSNTHSSGDPLPTDSLRTKRSNPIRVQNLTWTPETFAFCPGIPQPCLHAFDDERALQFGDGAQDREDHFSSRCRGVHLLAEGNEVNSQCLEGLQSLSKRETERANLSKRQTHTTSNFLLCASAISRFSSGRESFAPLTP